MGKSMDRGSKKRDSKRSSKKSTDTDSGSKESSKKSSRKSTASTGSEKKGSRKTSKARKSDAPDLNLNNLANAVETKSQIIERPKCKFFGPCTLEARQAHTAILLLRSDEDKIVLHALNDLQKFCKQRDENKQIIVDSNGIEPLSKLVSSSNLVVQRIALKILSLTSHIRKAKLVLRDLEMFTKLVALVKSKDDVIVEYATGILANCATLYAARVDILENKGATIFSELITREDPDIQKNSLETIWRLLENRDCLHLFTVKKHLDAIMKHIDSEYPAIQTVALAIAQRISENKAELPKLEAYHLVRNYAVKLASMETADLHRVCLRTLVNMADRPAYADQMFKYLLGFAELLENTKDVEVLILIVTLFGKLSSKHSTNQHLVDIGVAQKLISILKMHANLDLLEASVYTVGQLAGDYRAKELLIAAIQPIIMFSEIRRNSAQASEYSFKALSSILEGGHEAGPAFLEYDGLRLILKIFVNPSKYSEITCVYAMNCAYAVSKIPGQRRFLVENGLVAGILMVMGIRDLKLITQACLALCGLMTDEVGRIQFMEKDGYLRILRALSCPETVVPLAFVPLISVLSKYQTLAHILIVKGVLKAMSIRIDLNTESAIFRSALDRLLKFHLPAKYAITGHIDYFEKLEDGFYDQGYLKKDEPFVHIQDMTYKTRNPTKRVIYLNLSNKFDHAVNQQNAILDRARENKDTVVNTYAVEAQEILNQDRGINTSESSLDEKLMIGVFATVIANRMGGQIDKFQLSSNSEEIEIANLQSLHKSVVVPVTMLKNGVFAPRALIFKALADIYGIPCSLERGGYNKCWNTVMLGSNSEHQPCPCADRKGNEHNMVFTEKLDRYVVDLVYQPGSLFPLHSYEAKTYCFK